MKKKPLELYIHIPFCKKKCLYCDFLSRVPEEGEMASYVDKLCADMKAWEYLKESHRVRSIFVGGGTPSLLEAGQMERLFAALRECFVLEEDPEVTVEANPESLTREKLRAYLRCAVNRISLGLQSVHGEMLAGLGRIHTYEDFLRSYGEVREAGFSNVNIDLMSGLPHQRQEAWEETLHTVAALSPEHISAYGLMIEKGTPFDREYGPKAPEDRRRALPSEEEEEAMYRATGEILAGYGYHRYEISNYARRGYECIHNLGYWERIEYLGLGQGAASFLDHKRWQQGEDEQVLSREEEMEEFMFLGLRKTLGVREKDFSLCFGSDIDEIYGEVLDRLKREKLLCREEGRIYLTPRGVDISNYVFGHFLLDEAEKKGGVAAP